jgi:hypothetical protein
MHSTTIVQLWSICRPLDAFLIVHPRESVPQVNSMVLYPGMSESAMTTSGLSSLVAQQAASRTKACAHLSGCIVTHGEFKCCFYRRLKGVDTQGRAEVSGQRRHVKPASWLLECPGDRMCKWRVNYNYSQKAGVFVLTPVVREHMGHTPPRSLSSSKTSVQSSNDVTADMWLNLYEWVRIPLGGERLRKVTACIVQ